MKFGILPSLLMVAALCHQAKAQDSIPVVDTTPPQAKNGWYAEIAGESTVGVTFNYERYFSRKPGGLSIHAGIGGIYFRINDNSAGFLAIPLGASYNIPTSKKYRSFVEIGGGTTFLSSGSGMYGAWYPVLGWRYLAKPNGMQIRTTCIPYMNIEGTSLSPWFGFSIGKKFGDGKRKVATPEN